MKSLFLLVLSLCISATLTAQSGVVINEFLASNDVTQADQDGEFDDWIELHNRTGVNINIANFTLTDNIDLPAKFTFPAGTTIAANGYLIIWADDDLDQAGLHAPFKLSAGGEQLALFNSGGAVIDSITFGEQETDVSVGRLPNGTGAFQPLMPTFNAQNVGGSYTREAFAKTINVFPNPIEAGQMLQVQGRDIEQAQIFTVTGQLVTTVPLDGSNQLRIPADLAAGTYLLQTEAGRQTLLIR